MYELLIQGKVPEFCSDIKIITLPKALNSYTIKIIIISQTTFKKGFLIHLFSLWEHKIA